jgi:hypothetical protein
VADRRYRAFTAALADAYGQSLAAVARDASAGILAKVTVIVAGGGARLPFASEIVKIARARDARSIDVTLAPLVPMWIQESRLLNALRDRFPQIAVPVGGALSQLYYADAPQYADAPNYAEAP